MDAIIIPASIFKYLCIVEMKACSHTCIIQTTDKHSHFPKITRITTTDLSIFAMEKQRGLKPQVAVNLISPRQLYGNSLHGSTRVVSRHLFCCKGA